MTNQEPSPSKHPYTVFALVDMATEEFLVAGVVKGEAECVDTRSNSGSYPNYYQRFATSVVAESPRHAEWLAEVEYTISVSRATDTRGEQT